MATTKNINYTTVQHALAIYPTGNVKTIFIPDGWDLDTLIDREFNDGMAIFAWRDSDQRVALVAPVAVATKKQHEAIMANVRTWLNMLPSVSYKTSYKQVVYSVLDGAGLIVQPAQKTVMFGDGSTMPSEIIDLISDWAKTAVYTLDNDPDDDAYNGGGDANNGNPDDNGGGGDANNGNPDDDANNGNPDDDANNGNNANSNNPGTVGANLFRQFMEEDADYSPFSWKRGERL